MKRQDIVFAPTGELPELREVFSARAMPGFNHDERRRARLAERRRRKRMIVGGLVQESMVPAGSLLSDETLDRIRAGQFRIVTAWDAPKRARSRKKKRGG